MIIEREDEVKLLKILSSFVFMFYIYREGEGRGGKTNFSSFVSVLGSWFICTY